MERNPITIKLEKKYTETKSSILKMIEIQRKAELSEIVQIDATECEYISPTCLAILTSLALNKNIKMTFFKGSHLNEKLKNYRNN